MSGQEGRQGLPAESAAVEPAPHKEITLDPQINQVTELSSP